LRRLLPLLLPLLAVGAVAWADDDGPAEGARPHVIDPLPFEHAEHARAFARAGVTCVDCHPVGLQQGMGEDGRAPVESLPGPIATCHGCHRAQLPGAPRKAPNTCATCHDDREGLKPASHGLDWLHAHGDQARAPGASCDTCHEASTCFDCHDQRGAMAESPHGPGFRSWHGIEAQADPASCTTCHTVQACTSCHATGGNSW